MDTHGSHQRMRFAAFSCSVLARRVSIPLSSMPTSEWYRRWRADYCEVANSGAQFTARTIKSLGCAKEFASSETMTPPDGPAQWCWNYGCQP